MCVGVWVCVCVCVCVGGWVCLISARFQVRQRFSAEAAAGQVRVQEAQGVVELRLTQPLVAGAHYRVLVNSQGSLWHSRREERVEGVARWDFFTSGYKPLRVTNVYPRPFSRLCMCVRACVSQTCTLGPSPGYACVCVCVCV